MNYTWVEIFNKIGWEVLKYKNNRKELLDIMYEILEELNLFDENKKKNCNLDKFNGERCKYDDFDPFSFMNRLAIYSEENRKKFIELFEKKTNMEVEIPNDFDGVPSVIPQNSCMILFKDDRNPSDIDDFWEFFEVALKLPLDSQNDELKNKFIKYYDISMKKQNCSWNLTSCLFRMNANYYFSLDSTNRNYLEKINKDIKIKERPDGKKYLQLIEKIKEYVNNSDQYLSLADLSHQAWKYHDKLYWLYSPGENASYWDECIKNNIMVIGMDELGCLTKYNSENEIMNALEEKLDKENLENNKSAIYDFVNKMQIGDIIIAKKGNKNLLGYGVVKSDYYYDNERNIYKNVRNVEWKKVGNWENTICGNPTKVLMEISKKVYNGYHNKLMKIFDESESQKDDINYYFISMDINDFDFIKLKIGKTVSFTSRGEEGQKRRNYSNFETIKEDDIVICYQVTPVKAIVGFGKVVEGLNEDGNITIEKTLQLDKKIDLSEFKNLNELKNMEFIINPNGTLFKLNKSEYDCLCNLILHKNPEINLELYSNNIFAYGGKNVIYYGGPGCGKSYLVKDLYCKDEELYIRTTFYPDYTNSDFVGQLIPIYENEKLKYKIEPGPFTRALKKAFEYKTKNVYLIIEEINRGNASAIFGDIFQLLDRDNQGKSEYKISNYIIEKYLTQELDFDESIEDNIYIPSNLSIIATMNTSDQNVFTLDSAFKRRWEMEYVTNIFAEASLDENTRDYDRELGSMYIPVEETNITWKNFVDNINDAIVLINSFGINSEDKQIGKYFVGKDYLVTNNKNVDPKLTKKFGEKVLSYLWEDVAKTDREEWFKYTKTFQQLLGKFVKEGISVFSDEVIRILNGDSSETGK